MTPQLKRRLGAALAALAIACIGLSLWRLAAARVGVTVERVAVGTIPATVFRPASGAIGPVIVIAHGFAGSQQLMQSFALAFARNGYTAVTFDFPGHGRNPEPLTGNVTEADGATRRLVDATARVADDARTLGDGRIAVLGHSMASDIVIRYAEAHPDVVATVAVSMFSPEVTAAAPRDLLVVVGDWEGMLKREALRAIGLAAPGGVAVPGVTYGDLAAGTGRRAAFSPHVEHASVLFSEASLRESLAWIDAAFGTVRTVPPRFDARGPWIMLLIAAVVLLAWPLSGLLPRLAAPPLGAGLGWRRLWLPLIVPPVVTPLLLRVLPTHFLPVLVGDYLAAHFLAYGVLTGLCLLALRWIGRPHPPAPGAALPFLGATAAVVGFAAVALVWPIDAFVTSFVPGPGRGLLVGAMLCGTLPFFLADEWATRGTGSGRLAYAASKLAFLASLALAVGLDFWRLFFLVIIVPVIALIFAVFGLFSGWIYRRTGNPIVAALANAAVFAWAIGVTFPLLAG